MLTAWINNTKYRKMYRFLYMHLPFKPTWVIFIWTFSKLISSNCCLREIIIIITFLRQSLCDFEFFGNNFDSCFWNLKNRFSTVFNSTLIHFLNQRFSLCFCNRDDRYDNVHIILNDKSLTAQL